MSKFWDAIIAAKIEGEHRGSKLKATGLAVVLLAIVAVVVIVSK